MFEIECKETVSSSVFSFLKSVLLFKASKAKTEMIFKQN